MFHSYVKLPVGTSKHMSFHMSHVHPCPPRRIRPLKWPLPKLANLGPGRQCDAFHRQKQGFVWDDIDYKLSDDMGMDQYLYIPFLVG